MTDQETKYMLSPERYQGHIVIDETRIPFVATISADLTGRLALEVEPIPFEGRSSDLLKLMRTSGRPGTLISEFRVECSSESGKRIESDSAFVTSQHHRNSTLDIGLVLSEATLRMELTSPPPAPSLAFRLRGFRSFGPALRAETPLGTVCAYGATKLVDTQQISGQIIVQAKEGAVSEHWRSEAEELLMHLRMALSFANGGSLTTPVVEYYRTGPLEVTFYNVGDSGNSEFPVQPFLHLEPFFKSVVSNFDAARPYRDAIANAIGWLMVETTHDEIRFLSGMTALENLASHHLPQQDRQLVSDEAFQRIGAEIAALIDRDDQIGAEVKSALKDKLRGLNRESLARNIKALFELWGVNRTDISNKMIRRLVDTRNDIVHRGLAQDDDALWELIILVREIIVRFVLALLRFEGHYECYVGGRHMRHFPPCEPVANS